MVVNGDTAGAKCTPLNGILGLVWLALAYFFAYIEFGLVFFIASLIYFIYASLGERRWSHEVSAYSVFNKDFRSIGGTLTGAQVDGEIRSGGYSTDAGPATVASSSSSSASSRTTSSETDADRDLRRRRARDAALRRVADT